MELWKNMAVPWEKIGLPEGVIIIYSLFLKVFVIISNSLFADFVASKPEGMKSAVGKFAKQKMSTGQCCHQQKVYHNTPYDTRVEGYYKYKY